MGLLESRAQVKNLSLGILFGRENLREVRRRNTINNALLQESLSIISMEAQRRLFLRSVHSAYIYYGRRSHSWEQSTEGREDGIFPCSFLLISCLPLAKVHPYFEFPPCIIWSLGGHTRSQKPCSTICVHHSESRGGEEFCVGSIDAQAQHQQAQRTWEEEAGFGRWVVSLERGVQAVCNAVHLSCSSDLLIPSHHS